MELITDWLIAMIFGGMTAFQLLFAPLVFTQLEMPVARAFIRRFFPFYYLYFAILCLISGVLTLLLNEKLPAFILIVCLLGFLVSRQLLMPLANDATDSGNKANFDTYHRLTVLINTLQLVAIAYLFYLR